MIRYYLTSENLKRISSSFTSIREVSSANDPDIEISINRFNSLYSWNEMFDLNDVTHRIDKGHRIFLFYFKNNVVGHCWIEHKPNYTYSYNIFIDKTVHDKSIVDSTVYFVMLSDKLFNEGVQSIQVDVDEWHKKSQDFCKRIGFYII